jgi:ankyrin repeat protein
MRYKPILSLVFFALFISGCTTMSPLNKAVKSCDLPAMNTLIVQGSNVNEKSSGKWETTSLHLAVYHCEDEEALKMIIALTDKGAALDTRDNYGLTPLLIAVNSKPKSALYLISKGADTGIKDNYGNTPLILAAKTNNLELIKALTQKSADVNAYNDEGNTPLINASIYGDVNIVKYLIEKGADPLHKDSYGNTARDYAKGPDKSDVAKLLKETENKPEFVKKRTYPETRIKHVVARVMGCMMPEIKEYSIAISSDYQPNASVNISGKITFTQGALRKWDDETLTFIAAHEIAHDKLGHVGKKIAASAVTTGVMIVAGHFIPGLGLLNYAINPAIVNNYSKTQEYDADKLASESCEKCFGMTKARQVEIMKNIRKTSSEGGGFWASHPSWSDRIENIKQ